MKRVILVGRIGLGIAALLAFAFAFSGCGNTFRPIANPIVQPGGDNGQLRNAIVVSTAGTGLGANNTPLFGATTQIDVSGDTITSQHTVGVNPVAALITAGNVFTVNAGDNTVTAYLLFGGPGSSTTTINLNTATSTLTCPVAAARTTTAVYVVMNGTSGNGCPSKAGQSGVAVVSANTLTESDAIPSSAGSMGVGADPEALAALPNGNEVYIANKGSNSVSVLNTIDNSFTVPNIAVGTSPAYVVPSIDNDCVYVANSGSGTVSVINASSQKVDETLTVGAGPGYMTFDANLQRVYVVNTTGNSVTVIQHSVTFSGTPAVPTCTSSVLRTVATGSGPTGVAALANGSRFYVANGGSGTVSVFDAQSFTLRSTITGLQPNPKSIAASGDSSRVYIVSATPQTEPLPASSTSSIAIVNTANDQLLVSQQGDPLQTLPPTVGGCTVSSTTPNCQLQTPDFVFLTQ